MTGASGLLGHALCSYLVHREAPVTGLFRDHGIRVSGVKALKLDLTEDRDWNGLLSEMRPDVVVHAAALTNVDACEKDPAGAERIHVHATRRLAAAAEKISAAFVYISTDQLWEGTRAFTAEDEPVSPINTYGLSKAAGEAAAREAHPHPIVIRTNFIGPGLPWRQSFSDWIVGTLARSESLRMFSDVFFTPIALAHLCPLIVDLVSQSCSGTFHVAGRERLSKAEFALRLAAKFDLPARLIEPTSVDSAALVAKRPKDMSLSTVAVSRILGRPMPDIAQAIDSLAGRDCHSAPW